MAVLPQNYPAESEQLTVLQNLLLEEVFRGAEYASSAARFSMVVKRPHKPAPTGSKEAGKAAIQPSGSGPKQDTMVASNVVERMQVDDVAKQSGVSAELTTLVATADIPAAQETGLPSTQELLEGLGDQEDSSAYDGGDVDMPPSSQYYNGRRRGSCPNEPASRDGGLGSHSEQVHTG
ncbi:PREDICTED: uncharacterized protein LOC108977791 [Bactrocera latifrons]|uniref:uncharacterized protein LOC108977791 n=1 Tax=Bactrocera latifrons TaxID=174628 RepID=UPI0008DE6082|nr:PREDICTED: uncharacterized protein LOC108977791 [Bactrocera latifrons]